MPGPGAYEQESQFDRMIEYEKSQRKKKGSHSVNPSLSHIVTSSNSTINMRDNQTTDDTVADSVFPRGLLLNINCIEITSSTTSHIKVNSSKSTLPSPRKDGNKFSKAVRTYQLVGYPNPKIGPGSYTGEIVPYQPNSFDRSVINGSQLTVTNQSTFGKSQRFE